MAPLTEHLAGPSHYHLSHSDPIFIISAFLLSSLECVHRKETQYIYSWVNYSQLRHRLGKTLNAHWCVCAHVCACVCVCVCELSPPKTKHWSIHSDVRWLRPADLKKSIRKT